MKTEQKTQELKLSKNQISHVLTDFISSEKDGLNEVFSMVLNGLMKSERASFLTEEPIDGNKGNGFRKASRSGIGSKLSLSIPRDRMGVFKPVILGLLDQQEELVNDLCFELYGKGLTTRQIEGVIAKIYGTSKSKSSISRITTDFGQYVKAWLDRSLDNYYPIIYVDAIHLKIRRDVVSTEAFYVLLGVKEDFTREVLDIVNIPQESASGWEEVLNGIKERGVTQVGLFVSDDLKELDTVIGRVYANSMQQKCVLHFMRNLSKHVRRTDREAFCKELKQVFYPEAHSSKQEAMERLQAFLAKWTTKYKKLENVKSKDNLELLFTYYLFDVTVRRMIYTTNWIERLNKSFRRTLKMRNALPTPDAAITLLGYVALEMTENKYSYPITSFKNDLNLNPNGV